MKKLIILVFTLLFIASAQQGVSQKKEFVKGTQVINAGIGLGTTLYSGTYYSSLLPPISGSYEYGIVEDLGIGSIGIGGYLGIAGSKYRKDDWGYNYTYVIIGARGAYHFYVAEDLDLYAGIMTGIRTVNYSEVGDPYGVTPQSGGVTSDIFGGVRYYFNPTIAVMSEVGFGISYLTVGVAFRL